MSKMVWIRWLSLLWMMVWIGCREEIPTPPPDEVTLQLKWVHQAQFAGFYAAEEKGYYSGENIRIHFQEGGPGVDIAQQVATGIAQFGVMSPEDILIQRSHGVPLKAIAAIYRRSAVVFVSRKDSGITRPSDLVGKRIACVDTGGSARDFTWQFFALMNQLGMDVSRMHLVLYDPEYTGFFNGEVDVTPAFSTGGLIKMRKIGFPVNLIWPDDYGIHFFSDTVFTTDQVVADRPDLVLRFLRASLKGWRDVVEDYSKAVDATVKRARIPDPVLQTSMMEAMLPLVHTGEDVIGWMKPERWREMAIHLIRYGMMKDKMEVDSAYTLQFLQEIYPGK